jgi:protein SCO1/2
MTDALLLTALLVGQVNSHDGLARPALPTSYRPAELNGAGVEQKLGQQVPLDLPFRDHTGKTVTLHDYSGQRPIVLVLAYFKCPMLCTEVLNGLFESLPKSGLSPDQYEIVVVSFDAREGPELAAAKRKHYLEAFARPGLDQRVHFLTGQQNSIDGLSNAIGFSFSFDARSDQFAHPGMITMLTPVGKIARYFFGIRFQPRDLRLGLVEASEGKIGTLTDSMILFCLFYDPNGATYAASVLRIVRLAGALTVAAIIGWVVWARLQEKRRTRGADATRLVET